MQIKQDVTVKTWDGTWTNHPKVLVTPESVEDLVEIMIDTVRFPRRCAGRPCIPLPA